ncbi:isatin hydrolase-like isoform X2 [Ptychodera flava]|uniref:isatin hydrolase-like isoform X2 n=1 Tax=Ptychodera flava TaxID=63121 RepID=UPI00396A79F3
MLKYSLDAEDLSISMEKLGALLLLCLSTATVIAHDESPFLEMTHPYNENSLSYPGFPGFEFTIWDRGYSEKFGIYLESNGFCTPEHCGTHMDAPAHFVQGKWRAHAVPLTSLIGNAVKVDIREKVARDVDAFLEIDDLESWEETHGRIPDDVILMIDYGWAGRYGNKILYFGTENDTSNMHFPGFHPDAARWVTENRKVKAIGVDTPSFDRGADMKFDSHLILFEHNIPVFENVANMDKLPATGATVFAIPMMIEDGSGAPLRVFATGWRPDVANPFSMRESVCDGQQSVTNFNHSLLVIMISILFLFQ